MCLINTPEVDLDQGLLSGMLRKVKTPDAWARLVDQGGVGHEKPAMPIDRGRAQEEAT